MFCCCGSCRSRQTLGAWCDIEANGAVRARITSGRATGVLETGTDLFEERYELRFVYRARFFVGPCVWPSRLSLLSGRFRLRRRWRAILY